MNLDPWPRENAIKGHNPTINKATQALSFDRGQQNFKNIWIGKKGSNIWVIRSVFEYRTEQFDRYRKKDRIWVIHSGLKAKKSVSNGIWKRKPKTYFIPIFLKGEVIFPQKVVTKACAFRAS